ncbi:fumarylacetoacetate hydrolase family protein [Cryobacterium sp. SO1]|uniref:fumarylacetoacetate hydrolase family protein n=1 Tax=Cryobacterium sp. SO1 TaxID=1897061 RepID=UPI001023409B|nr:fumarylacetoacetate hydrolase family protein [Cryobacterium sp. SO1]RZI34841.1 Ureidoglycolate lyase [Cryobacterium sp. SO1]
MRIAVIDSRAKIVRGDEVFDIAGASAGLFGPDAQDVYDQWKGFLSWADSADLGPGAAFAPEECDSPVPRPRQIFGIGLNYHAHQIESGLPAPATPLVFAKFVTSVAPAIGELVLFTDQVDWEVEAAIVIGTEARHVDKANAWAHVAGVTAAQDYSARDVQMRPVGTPQFSLGKSFPGYTPLGPVLVSPDEFENPDDIQLSCAINGRTVQSSSTADMIFSVGELIAYLSAILPLLPGDVILTGTPSGVALGMNPPEYLRAGDQITSVVGDQTQRHVAIAQS